MSSSNILIRTMQIICFIIYLLDVRLLTVEVRDYDHDDVCAHPLLVLPIFCVSKNCRYLKSIVGEIIAAGESRVPWNNSVNTGRHPYA
jgi:hypothetical protein